MLFEKSRPSEGGDSSSSPSTTSFLAGQVKRQQVPSFRQMNDKEDVEVFLAAFEGHMTSHGVSLENWAKHLLPTLSGDTISTLIRMPADKRGDYKKIKEKLLTKYHITKEKKA